jgi:hypothetical protein
MLLAAIIGGVFGLSVAWAMNYYTVMKDNKEYEREMAELEEIRKSYRKTR